MHMADALEWHDDAGPEHVSMGAGLGPIDIFSENAAGQAIGTNPTCNQADISFIFA